MAEGGYTRPKASSYYIDFDGKVVRVPEGQMIVLNDAHPDVELPHDEDQRREAMRQRMMGNA